MCETCFDKQRKSAAADGLASSPLADSSTDTPADDQSACKSALGMFWAIMVFGALIAVMILVLVYMMHREISTAFSAVNKAAKAAADSTAFTAVNRAANAVAGRVGSVAGAGVNAALRRP